jgi:hypothetical protein
MTAALASAISQKRLKSSRFPLPLGLAVDLLPFGTWQMAGALDLDGARPSRFDDMGARAQSSFAAIDSIRDTS